MKKILSIAVAALMLTACNRNSTYTIEGSFNIPTSYQVGDTIIERGPIEGTVYLFSLDGIPLDSVEVENEKFTFTGPVNPDMPYFAYVISEYVAGMLVIEPGVMQAVLGEPVVVRGTPTNDKIANMMEEVDMIGSRLADDMEALQRSTGEALTQETILPVYTKYSDMVTQIVDSIYQANSENLLGVYCANVMTAQARSAEEMEAALEPLSDFVKNSELIQQHLSYLKEVAAQSYGEDNSGN